MGGRCEGSPGHVTLQESMAEYLRVVSLEIYAYFSLILSYA